MLASLDSSVEERYRTPSIFNKFAGLFEETRSLSARKGGGYKFALRMTRGPTHSCIDFHRDGGYATSTTQIPLNSPADYKGGQLCFFVNDQLLLIPRPRGSVIQHPPQVLHGVTSVTEGTRKSLFIVDAANGLGEEGVVELTSDDVTSILAHCALVADKGRKRAGDKRQREEAFI